MRQVSGETLSEPILLALQASIPTVRTGRWREAAVAELTLGTRRHGLPRDFVETVRAFKKFIPDAYLIDKEERCLHFFEIEIFNPMREAKLDAYGWFATDMAGFGIDFGVYTVNKYGHINRVDLLPYYIRAIRAAGTVE